MQYKEVFGEAPPGDMSYQDKYNKVAIELFGDLRRVPPPIPGLHAAEVRPGIVIGGDFNRGASTYRKTHRRS